MTTSLTRATTTAIITAYKAAPRRVICLDYDGTLVDFAATPSAATPPAELIQLLSNISNNPKNTVAIVSGRSRSDLQLWFGHMPLLLAAEHGHFIRPIGGEWHVADVQDANWKLEVRSYIEGAVQQVPGSFIEEKETALVWPDPAVVAAVLPVLAKQLAVRHAALLPGSYVLEVRAVTTSKAVIFKHVPATPETYMLVVGDDITDESMFAAAPSHACTIKVGLGASQAHYRLTSPAVTRRFLRGLLDVTA